MPVSKSASSQGPSDDGDYDRVKSSGAFLMPEERENTCKRRRACPRRITAVSCLLPKTSLWRSKDSPMPRPEAKRATRLRGGTPDKDHRHVCERHRTAVFIWVEMSEPTSCFPSFMGFSDWFVPQLSLISSKRVASWTSEQGCRTFVAGRAPLCAIAGYHTG